jgi:hypothetical protein
MRPLHSAGAAVATTVVAVVLTIATGGVRG